MPLTLSSKHQSEPITSEEFNQLMKPMAIGASSHIAVGVSGGSDSMALTFLLSNWCRENHVHLTAITVDHALRKGSKEEADQVSKWMSDKKIAHRILTWQGLKPTSDIQSEARNARYTLLGEWCINHNAKHLFLAHHKEDQAETFLIRLFRGSGVDGLSGMETMSTFPNGNRADNAEIYPMLCRPLITISKTRLTETLSMIAHAWINDPSNDNPQFTRIKVRELLKSSNIEGLNADRLTTTANRMRRVRSLLEDMTIAAESVCVKYDKCAFAILNVEALLNNHEEISFRLLSTILKKMSGGAYAPRYAKLENLYKNLCEGAFLGQTISGCIVCPIGNKEVGFFREESAIKDQYYITDEKQYLWDNRILINTEGLKGIVAKFEHKHLQSLSHDFPDINERLKEIFHHHEIRQRALSTLPCLTTPDENVMLPEFLSSMIGYPRLKGFSANFKI